MEAPERIWASGQDAQPAGRWWHETRLANGVEYVRADLYEAQAAQIAELTAKLEAAEAKLARLVEVGDALNCHAAHVYLGATIDGMNVTNAALNLGPMVNAWDAALREIGGGNG